MAMEIGFKVLNIKKAETKDFVVIDIQFDTSEKVYNYVRKSNNNKVLIDGCEIKFNDNYEVKSIERKYVVKGKFRRKNSQAQQEGMGDKKKNKKPVEAIKEEMQEQQIEKPAIVIPEQNGEVHHEKYELIKTCLTANIPVYLAGPAGSGKNHTVEQIAKELGWNFYFSNSVQQEFKLTGFIDAGGKFHDTEFYKACTCENDCIFFLDEMDASIPEVLVLLNAAIANGYFEFPCGRVDFNKVHFVAAGNTVGSGADDMYTGRMVLDQATLDRFAIIEFDYSMVIEMALTKNNSELVNFIHQLRDEAKEKGIRATFSYRCMTMVRKLEKAGLDTETILKISVFKGMDKDTINTFNPSGSSKYHKALNNMKY